MADYYGINVIGTQMMISQFHQKSRTVIKRACICLLYTSDLSSVVSVAGLANRLCIPSSSSQCSTIRRVIQYTSSSLQDALHAKPATLTTLDRSSFISPS